MPEGGGITLNADVITKLYNTEAEQGLIGSILCDNRLYEHVADLVRIEDFGHPSHGRIWSAIGSLISSGSAANPVTLLPMAPEFGIERQYIIQLAASVVTTLNAVEYAKMIADLSRRRELVAAAQESIADAVVIDPERPSAMILDDAEQRLFSIGAKSESGAPRRLGEIVTATVERIAEAYKAGGAITVDTGLADLDRIIAGMGAGDLCVMAGRPAMGKSALAGSVAFNAAKAGKRVLIFSLEMSREELAQRWIAGLTGIATDRQRHGQLNQSEWEAIIGAQERLSALPILVDDQPRLSVPQMRQRARRVRRRHGLDLIIIDHLQLIRQGGKQESRRLEIGDATSSLKAVAKEVRVPVLLLSQLSRAPEQRNDKRPMLSDLRESGDIEQDADVVMFLYRDEYYLERSEPKHKPGQTADAIASERADWQARMDDARGVAEIAVAKNRHGRTGTVWLRFDAPRQRFENMARGY